MAADYTSELPDRIKVDTMGRQLSAGERVPVTGWSLVLLRRAADGRTPPSGAEG